MKAPNSISFLAAALATRGFKPDGVADDGWLKFQGELRTSTEVHACEMAVDASGVSLPRIWLKKVPDSLPAVTPHLHSDGYLCYLADGSVVLDIFDIPGQVLACIARAELVLGQLMRGEMVQDLEDEFHIKWAGPICLLDVQGKQPGKCRAFLIEKGEMAVVTDDLSRTQRKLNAIQAIKATLSKEAITTFRVKTNAKPRMLIRNWPPATVGELLLWQGALDPKCCKQVDKRLHNAYVDRSADRVLVMVESPLLTYGFLVVFKRPGNRRGMRQSPRGSLYAQRIYPRSVVRVDDRYLAERNVPGRQTLSGMRIALVGCGTIGGFLAEMLVKAGAGMEGGRLTMVDFESLYPANVGRHRLGFHRLYANKATGLTEELELAAPGANLRALPVDVRQAQLGRLDLLIDATGEEALGHWLAAKYSNTVTTLSAWIEGPGVAVRVLLKVPGSGACRRCVSDANRRKELMTVSEDLPLTLAGHGCEGLYVPFAATVSVQAAGLAATVALDWANQAVKHTLQTRLADLNYQLLTADCDPPRNTACPACHS